MSFFRAFIGCSVCLLIASTMAGCSEALSKPDWPDTVPCVGAVTRAGKPLSETMVLFIPDLSTTGQGGSGKTDESGKFVVSSRNAVGETTPGLIPGKYRVAFSRMVKPDGTIWTPDASNSSGPATVGAREELPMTYSDPSRTKFLIDVVGGGASHDFDLK